MEKITELNTKTSNIAVSDERLAVMKLGEKIEQLSISIGAMQKDGNNTFSHYKYISSEQMVTSLRTKCLANKVSILPSVSSYTEREFQSDKGKTSIRTTVMMDFKVIDLETGYFETLPFVGSEQDNGGKSMQQAITQCCKYFYFKLFNVTSHDDIDGDGKTTVIEPPKVEPKPIPTLNAEQFTLAMKSDAKGITATLKAITDGKITAGANQINSLNKQLLTLNK